MKRNSLIHILKYAFLASLVLVFAFSLLSCSLADMFESNISVTSNSKWPEQGGSTTSSTVQSIPDGEEGTNPDDDDQVVIPDTVLEYTVTFRQEGCADVVYTVRGGESVYDYPILNSIRGYDVKWENVDLSNINSDIVVNAVATPKSYSITYIIDNGTNSAENPTSYTVESGEFELLPAINDGGIPFAGWYTTPDYVIGTMVESIECYYKDITLYAHWLEYELYDLDGFTQDVDNPTKYYLTVDYLTNSYNILSQAEYSIGCYLTLYLDESCNFEVETENVTVNSGTNKFYLAVNHNTGNYRNVYEIEILRPETATYAFIADNNEVMSAEVKAGTSINCPDSAPQKDGYKFTCWTVNGEEVTFPYVLNKDTTFVARYVPTKYTVTYVMNGGENNSQNKTTYDVNSNVTLYNPTREHYYFNGWYTDPYFTNQITKIEPGNYGNITLYAKWTAKVFNIVYEYNNETPSRTVNFTVEDLPISLPYASLAGYNSYGWYTEGGDGAPITRITEPKNYILSAHYYTITYAGNANGYTITKYKGTGKTFAIPSEYNGMPVTTIGDKAFYSILKLDNIIIPSSITSINREAFSKCENLKRVYIDDITSWCQIVFTGLDSNPLYYAKNLYLNGELVTDLELPETVKKVSSFAFYNCESLTSIYIPSSIETLGGNIFVGCKNLKTIYLAAEKASLSWNGNWNKDVTANIVWNYKKQY